MKLEPSAFDSQHYALRIGRMTPGPESEPEANLAAGLETAREQGFDVVFLRLEEADALCEALARRGELPVDTLVTSRLGSERRAARERGVVIEHHDCLFDGDVKVIAAITAEAITTSHLHADPRLPLVRTRALYAEWASNDVTGRAQHVIVARAGGVIAGFISVVRRSNTAVIDLIAVAATHRGHGVGSAMLASFIDWVDSLHLTATVGTQATNPALALYARHGFVPTERHVTYHLWLTP